MADRNLKRQRDESDLGPADRAKRQQVNGGKMTKNTKDSTKRDHEPEAENELSHNRGRRGGPRENREHQPDRRHTNGDRRRDVESKHAEDGRDDRTTARRNEIGRSEDRPDTDSGRTYHSRGTRHDAKAGRNNRARSPSSDALSINVLEAPEEECESVIKQCMGFVKFKTTQNTKVPGNDKLYHVRKEKKTEYRQYMNRLGGFNRPLSPS